MKSEILFSEKQRFSQPWLWIMLLGLNALFVFGLVLQVFLGKQFGDKPLPDIGLIIVTGLTFLFTYFFRNMRMETRIGPDGIYVQFFPFHRNARFYPWDAIDQCYVRQYSPMREYGGWGIRGVGKNRAFNVSGSEGIQLIMRTGSRLLIGTRKPGEAKHALIKSGHLTDVQPLR